MNEEKLIEEREEVFRRFIDGDCFYKDEACGNRECKDCFKSQIHELYKKYTYLKGNEEWKE